ncbi:MAG: hypothetical protein LBD62_02460 [Candidatus Margulisbacteria bacterium]|jgi:hypothetical protein|nr:hypothetical protein [Candidatus Margulisiibacteriota bacterium]
MAEKAKKNWEPKIIYVYLVCLLAMSVVLFNSVLLPYKITDLFFVVQPYYVNSDTKIDRLQSYNKNNAGNQMSFEEYNKILDEQKTKKLQDRKIEKIKDLINSLLAIAIAALFFKWHWAMRKD